MTPWLRKRLQAFADYMRGSGNVAMPEQARPHESGDGPVQLPGGASGTRPEKPLRKPKPADFQRHLMSDAELSQMSGWAQRASMGVTGDPPKPSQSLSSELPTAEQEESDDVPMRDGPFGGPVPDVDPIAEIVADQSGNAGDAPTEDGGERVRAPRLGGDANSADYTANFVPVTGGGQTPESSALLQAILTELMGIHETLRNRSLESDDGSVAE